MSGERLGGTPSVSHFMLMGLRRLWSRFGQSSVTKISANRVYEANGQRTINPVASSTAAATRR